MRNIKKSSLLELLAGPSKTDRLLLDSLAKIAVRDRETLRTALISCAYAPWGSIERMELLYRTADLNQPNRRRTLEYQALTAANNALGSHILWRIYHPGATPAVLGNRLRSDPVYQRAYQAWRIEPSDRDRFSQAGALYLANVAELIGDVPEIGQRVYIDRCAAQQYVMAQRQIGQIACVPSLAPIERVHISANGVV